MHELSVTENILDIATRHAIQAGASRVTSIHLVIGKLASIVDDSVSFYWDIISKDSICAGSILDFEHIPAQVQCKDCGTIFELERELIPCPQCQGLHLKIIKGEEFWVDSIEIETTAEQLS